MVSACVGSRLHLSLEHWLHLSWELIGPTPHTRLDGAQVGHEGWAYVKKGFKVLDRLVRPCFFNKLDTRFVHTVRI